MPEEEEEEEGVLNIAVIDEDGWVLSVITEGCVCEWMGLRAGLWKDAGRDDESGCRAVGNSVDFVPALVIRRPLCTCCKLATAEIRRALSYLEMLKERIV